MVSGNQERVFATWPGLTCQAVDKYLDKSLVSTKGYLRQSYQGVRSTLTSSPSLDETHPNLSTPYNKCFVKIKPLGRVYTDQTGKFPYVSSRGYKYIMVLYTYDFNAILSTPLR